MQNLPRVGKNSGPILSRLWAKVREVLRRCRGTLVVFDILVRLSMANIFGRKHEDEDKDSRRRRKNDHTCTVLATNFWESSLPSDDPNLFYKFHLLTYLLTYGEETVCIVPLARI